MIITLGMGGGGGGWDDGVVDVVVVVDVNGEREEDSPIVVSRLHTRRGRI